MAKYCCRGKVNAALHPVVHFVVFLGWSKSNGIGTDNQNSFDFVAFKQVTSEHLLVFVGTVVVCSKSFAFSR